MALVSVVFMDGMRSIRAAMQGSATPPHDRHTHRYSSSCEVRPRRPLARPQTGDGQAGKASHCTGLKQALPRQPCVPADRRSGQVAGTASRVQICCLESGFLPGVLAVIIRADPWSAGLRTCFCRHWRPTHACCQWRDMPWPRRKPQAARSAPRIHPNRKSPSPNSPRRIRVRMAPSLPRRNRR